VTETDLPVLSDLSDSELLTIQETIKAVEAVLAMAKGEKEFAFVNLLTRCLARFLCPDPEKQLHAVEENVRKLHDFAYQRLNLIGPAHPEVGFCNCLKLCQTFPALLTSYQRLSTIATPDRVGRSNHSQAAATGEAQSNDSTAKSASRQAASTQSSSTKASNRFENIC
jgi:hypothetical protein